MAKKKSVDLNLITRAFEMPIQAVEPKEFWAVIREAWRQSALLANWAAQVLARNDVIIYADTLKLPPMPPVDLYALAFGRAKARPSRKGGEMLPPVRAGFRNATDNAHLPGYPGADYWAGAKKSASTILQRVQKSYMRDRADVLWQRRRRPVLYTEPHPFHVHGQDWVRAFWGPERKPHIELCLPGGRAVIRLRGGGEFKRQLGIFGKIVAEDLPRKELVIYSRQRTNSFHRRGNGKYRDMVKLVADLPKPPPKEGRVMNLTVLPEAFWAAELDGREGKYAWVLNAPHLRRLLAVILDYKEVYLPRLAQDRKAERRCSLTRVRNDKRLLSSRANKFKNRVDSFCHEAAAQAVNFAVRSGVAELVYDDSGRHGLPSMPWHKLKQLLADKCAAAGINFVDMAPHHQEDRYEELTAIPEEGD